MGRRRGHHRRYLLRDNEQARCLGQQPAQAAQFEEASTSFVAIEEKQGP
jgi:hypothetical protein